MKVNNPLPPHIVKLGEVKKYFKGIKTVRWGNGDDIDISSQKFEIEFNEHYDPNYIIAIRENKNHYWVWFNGEYADIVE